MTKFLADVGTGYYEEFRVMGYIDGLEDNPPKLDPMVDNAMAWVEYATAYTEGLARRKRNLAKLIEGPPWTLPE